MEPGMMGSWGSSGHPDCPQMTDVSPNRWGEPMIRSKGMMIKMMTWRRERRSDWFI